jgi:hypothetical protein
MGYDAVQSCLWTPISEKLGVSILSSQFLCFHKNTYLPHGASNTQRLGICRKIIRDQRIFIYAYPSALPEMLLEHILHYMTARNTDRQYHPSLEFSTHF